MENKTKRRWGYYRWWVLLFIVLNIISVILIYPVRPHIQVAPENIIEHPLFTLPVLGKFYFTNTMTMLVLALLVLIGLAWIVRSAYKDGGLQMPKGIAGAIEMLIEVLYNLTESTAGKFAKVIFPWFATILLFVLVANLLELTPIVETFGVLREVTKDGHPIQQLWQGAYTVVSGKVAEGAPGYAVAPVFRGLPTDLNFTAALALISVIMTSVIGVRAQGMMYFTKFFNYLNLFKKPFFGAMDFLVGLLELISEFSKILSFAFRLFGNIFAGAVLLALVGSLIPVFAQSFVVLFEVFIGAIQAFVFGMLTMVFMAQATQGHGEEHDQAEA